MKKSLHTHLESTREQYSLTHDERARMRAALREYAAIKPVRVSRARTHAPRWIFAPLMRPVALALVAVFFISSGGVAYAAQSALPGDPLYAVKVDITEPLQGALATSASARADWALQVAGKRVQEVATLAAEGKLTPQVQQQAQQSFDSHAAIALKTIAQEASASPDVSAEASLRAQSQLGEYGRVLAEVGRATKANVAAFASAVTKKSAEAGALHAHAQALVSADNGAQATVALARIREAARSGLDLSAQLARASDGTLASSSAQAVAAQLGDASSSIESGNRLLSEKSAPQALAQYQRALAATEQLGVYLQTTAAIHARTGMVVEEPTESRGASAAARASTRNSASARGAVRASAASEVHAASGLMPAPASTSTASTTQEAATSTGEQHGSAPAQENPSLNSEDHGEQHSHEHGQQKFLPIAAPHIGDE